MTQQDSDEALYRCVRQGDLAAFDRLYERYERRLFCFILHMVHDRQDAEDLFHEAFLGVLRSPDVRFTEASFSTWIFRVARNRCLNHLRDRRRELDRRARLETLPAASPDPPDERLGAAQQRSALDHAVAALPLRLSEVYHLRVQGLSLEDMAAVLEIPVGTVKSRMNLLVRRLKQEIGVWNAS